MTTLTSWLVYPIIRKYLLVRKTLGDPRLLWRRQRSIPNVYYEEEYDDYE